MDWLRYGAIGSLLVVAIVAGGAAVRVGVAVGDLRAAAALGLVVLFVVLTVAAGARSRRWRQNPYW